MEYIEFTEEELEQFSLESGLVSIKEIIKIIESGKSYDKLYDFLQDHKSILEGKIKKLSEINDY